MSAVLAHPEAICRHCRGPFLRKSSMHAVCSPKCLFAEQRSKEKAERAERIETKARLTAMLPRGHWQKQAQAAFNRYVRMRDRAAGHGCICCGAPLEWHSKLTGGSVDAGHFLSRGASPELAFDERNVNAQRKSCNRPGGATRSEFRAGMVARWGEAVVAELEGPHPPSKLSIDDLKEIRRVYDAKALALAKETA